MTNNGYKEGFAMGMDSDRTIEFETKCDKLSKLRIIIFKNPKNLRSHCVKHFIKSQEWNRVWKDFINNAPTVRISDTIRALEETGCPYYCQKLIDPPCLNCPLYSRCGDFLEEWERKYTDVIGRIINTALQKPLFASYYGISVEGDFKGWFMGLLSAAFTIYVSCHKINKGYNVQTAYYQHLTRAEIVSKIERFAKKEVKFCTRTTWGIYTPPRKQACFSNTPNFLPINSARRQELDWKEKLAIIREGLDEKK